MRWGGWGILAAILIHSIHTAWAIDTASRAPASILIDAATGEVLKEEQADDLRPPGALSRLMIVLLSLEQANLGMLPLNLPVAVDAATVGPTVFHADDGNRIPLQADRSYLLSDLLKAILVGSADDAAAVTAAAIAGSVPACLDLMNGRAQRLQMRATHFATVGGAPRDAAGDPGTTTARDLARLAQVLVRQAAVLQWASLSGLPFDQGATLLRNVNQLIGAVPGGDGLQVWNGRAAGYSIVATAQRAPLRLIAVVLNAKDSVTRYGMAAELLEWGFARYERLELLKRGEPLAFPIRVVNGSVAQLTPILGQTASLLRRRDEEHDLQIHYQLPSVLAAPVRRDQEIGEVIVQERGRLVAVIPVLSPVDVTSTSTLSAALSRHDSPSH
jgi:D-alanyl-D-alanine carboxypeptidase (penicillin-binding protein 5/6)